MNPVVRRMRAEGLGVAAAEQGRAGSAQRGISKVPGHLLPTQLWRGGRHPSVGQALRHSPTLSPAPEAITGRADPHP